MARRSKASGDLSGPIAQLAGLAVLLGLIYPPFRQMMVSIGVGLVVLVVLVIITVIGIGIYKARSRRRAPLDHFSFQTSVAPPPVTTLNPFVSSTAPEQSLATPQLTDQSRARDKPLTTGQLIDQMRSIDWFQFEQLVALVYRKHGYAVSRRGGANPDGGIDLVIQKDGARTAIQCKQWKTRNVGVKAVREFLGALTDSGLDRGLFITLGGYTGEAKQLADKHGIEVVNETGLADQIEATDARFDPAVLEILRDRRKLCPKCESEMVLRTATKGPGAGHQFWGCSGYPRCRFTMPLQNDELSAARCWSSRA